MAQSISIHCFAFLLGPVNFLLGLGRLDLPDPQAVSLFFIVIPANLEQRRSGKSASEQFSG
jgi:hypothetical protein